MGILGKLLNWGLFFKKADTLLVISIKKGSEIQSNGDKHRCVPSVFFDVMGKNRLWDGRDEKVGTV